MMYLNCDIQIFDGEGKYDIPKILPEHDVKVDGWRMFEEVRNRNLTDGKNDYDVRRNLGVHFFQDDHKFETVWTHPNTHLDKLRMYGCVLSPDFSM